MLSPDRQDPARALPLHRRIKRSAAYVALREWGKSLKRRAKLHHYRGSEFRCPICHVGLRAFKPIWKSYWRSLETYGWVYQVSQLETFNAQAFTCPRCDAYDRERLTALYLERVFQNFDRKRRYRLIEFSPAHALHKAIKRHPFIEYRSSGLERRDVHDRVDMTDMRAYADNSCDIFLASHILEHIPDDRKAMRELCRILRPDGFGIVLVPLIHGLDETQENPEFNTFAQRCKYYGDGDHLRQYGRRDFLERLAAAGFTVEQVGIETFGAEAFRANGIAEDSILYVVRKKPAAKSSASSVAVQ
jgi:SAM-dependent methyltransferase